MISGSTGTIFSHASPYACHCSYTLFAIKTRSNLTVLATERCVIVVMKRGGGYGELRSNGDEPMMCTVFFIIADILNGSA